MTFGGVGGELTVGIALGTVVAPAVVVVVLTEHVVVRPGLRAEDKPVVHICDGAEIELQLVVDREEPGIDVLRAGELHIFELGQPGGNWQVDFECRGISKRRISAETAHIRRRRASCGVVRVDDFVVGAFGKRFAGDGRGHGQRRGGRHPAIDNGRWNVGNVQQGVHVLAGNERARTLIFVEDVIRPVVKADRPVGFALGGHVVAHQRRAIVAVDLHRVEGPGTLVAASVVGEDVEQRAAAGSAADGSRGCGAVAPVEDGGVIRSYGKMNVGICVPIADYRSATVELELVALPYEEVVALAVALAEESGVVRSSPGIEVEFHRGGGGRQHAGLDVLGAGRPDRRQLAVAGRQETVRNDLVVDLGLFARVAATTSNVDSGGADVVGVGIGHFVVAALGKNFARIPVTHNHFGIWHGKRVVFDSGNRLDPERGIEPHAVAEGYHLIGAERARIDTEVVDRPAT